MHTVKRGSMQVPMQGVIPYLISPLKIITKVDLLLVLLIISIIIRLIIIIINVNKSSSFICYTTQSTFFNYT